MAVRAPEPERCVLDRYSQQQAGREELQAPSTHGVAEARRDHRRDQEVKLPHVGHIANRHGQGPGTTPNRTLESFFTDRVARL